MPWNAKKIKPKAALGRRLIKNKNLERMGFRGTADSDRHEETMDDGADWARLNIKSITQETTLNEFLSTAQLAAAEFSDVEDVRVVRDDDVTTQQLPAAVDHDVSCDVLRIPRRPQWCADMKKETLIKREKESFLNWRRELSKIQSNQDNLITPFEKNLEYWRQFWRVIEKSDVVVQVVDSRNPLLFYMKDIDVYSREVSSGKRSLILLNKSDLLTEDQRKSWYGYFVENNMDHVFFSALEEDQGDDDDDGDDSRSDASETNDHQDSDDDDYEDVTTSDEDNEGTSQRMDGMNLRDDQASSEPEANKWDVLSPNQLMNYFKRILRSDEPKLNDGHVVIGLVGYPNVGKSSTINSMMKSKKVSVSATPGKTKHFQTICMDSQLVICDSPGLVFPSFVSTKADMIIHGILPIDEMTDHVSAVNLLCGLFRRRYLASFYGVPQLVMGDMKKQLTSEEFLNAYGYKRGFMTQRGLPDHPKTSRLVLKDFVLGKLLYCYAPPGVDQASYHVMPEPDLAHVRELTAGEKKLLKATTTGVTVTQFDREFFQSRSGGIHSKGSSCLVNMTNPGQLPPKGFKKHQNRNKREKLRRVYAHLDS